MKACIEALEDWKPSRATPKKGLDLFPSKSTEALLSIEELQYLLYMAGTKEVNNGQKIVTSGSDVFRL